MQTAARTLKDQLKKERVLSVFSSLDFHAVWEIKYFFTMTAIISVT